MQGRRRQTYERASRLICGSSWKHAPRSIGWSRRRRRGAGIGSEGLGKGRARNRGIGAGSECATNVLGTPLWKGARKLNEFRSNAWPEQAGPHKPTQSHLVRMYKMQKVTRINQLSKPVGAREISVGSAPLQ